MNYLKEILYLIFGFRAGIVFYDSACRSLRLSILKRSKIILRRFETKVSVMEYCLDTAPPPFEVYFSGSSDTNHGSLL